MVFGGHRDMVVVGANLHALVRFDLNSVVLGLQKELAGMGDMAHVAALSECAEAIPGVDDHTLASRQLQISLGGGVQMLTRAEGDGAGRAGGDSCWRGKRHDRLCAFPHAVGLVIGAMAQVTYRFGQVLAWLVIMGDA
ncbi:hypothetical protein CR64_03075 [Pseudomonas aeruginosa]|nr:hypothetical protein CR64_03075 [Pseudomonas aeruginosa]